jgi:4-oxalocrotonate tautomerase
MPIVEITLIEGRSPETKLKLIRAVTNTVIDCTAAPRQNVRVMIWEIPADDFAVGGLPKKPRRSSGQRKRAHRRS